MTAINGIGVEIIRSQRKTAAIQVKRDGCVVVRAPMKMPESLIRKFVNDNILWIEKQIEKKRLEASSVDQLTNVDIRALADEALKVIPTVVNRYARLMGVTYGRITIRNQKTRWGSCSSKGNLNFNCLLMLCPRAAMEYVVVHELCHRKHMNHSKEFWREVEKYCPDYKLQKKWFKVNGSGVIERLS